MASGYWLLASGSLMKRGSFPLIKLLVAISQLSNNKTLKTMRNFKNYEIWVDSIELTISSMICVKGFPKMNYIN